MATGLDEGAVHKTGWQARGQLDRQQAQVERFNMQVAYSKSAV